MEIQCITSPKILSLIAYGSVYINRYISVINVVESRIGGISITSILVTETNIHDFGSRSRQAFRQIILIFLLYISL